MLNLFKTTRCQNCYTERLMRDCPRKNKKICWHCCNELRCDGKCPTSCAYAPREVENSPFPSFKADSQSENSDVIKLFIDLWSGRPHPGLDNLAPRKLAADDPQRLLEWLSGFQFPSTFPLEYLMQKLALPHQNIPPLIDPESVVSEYLDCLISLEWNELRQYTINTGKLPDLAERYAELLSSITTLKKVDSYSILNAGLGENGGSAIVYVELNHKTDWTFVLTFKDNNWLIRQNIAGSPQHYFAQNQIYTQIAEALGKADDAKSWELLEAALKIYPDSADLYYYRALYWQLVKQPDKATVDFFNAVALDNGWHEPYFHLGAIYLAKKDFAQAEMWLQELVALHPDDPNALNNLAAAYAGQNKLTEAGQLWQDLVHRFPGFELARQNLERLNK